MLTFEGFPTAREAIMDFRADHFDQIPEHMKARFKELAASPAPVDQVVRLGEFIYANREHLGDDAKSLGAGLIAFATSNAFHGLQDDDRGNRIVANLRKDLGEIKTAPAAPAPAMGAVIEPPVDEAAADEPAADEPAE